MYRIDPARLDLVWEFKAHPTGPHSPELKRLVNRLRMGPLSGRYLLVCRKRHREWVLGKLSGTRGARIEIFADAVFDSVAAGEWEVFKRRFEAHTGIAIDEAGGSPEAPR
jgi:hypothetical protein